jgi:hypothetical protein
MSGPHTISTDWGERQRATNVLISHCTTFRADRKLVRFLHPSTQYFRVKSQYHLRREL